MHCQSQSCPYQLKFAWKFQEWTGHRQRAKREWHFFCLRQLNQVLIQLFHSDLESVLVMPHNQTVNDSMISQL